MSKKKPTTETWPTAYDLPSGITGIRDLIRLRYDRARADLNLSGYNSRTWRTLLRKRAPSADNFAALDLNEIPKLRALLDRNDAEGAAYAAYTIGRRHEAERAIALTWHQRSNSGRNHGPAPGLLAAARYARKEIGPNKDAQQLFKWLVSKAKGKDGLEVDGFKIMYGEKKNKAGKTEHTLRQEGHKGRPIPLGTFRKKYLKNLPET